MFGSKSVPNSNGTESHETILNVNADISLVRTICSLYVVAIPKLFQIKTRINYCQYKLNPHTEMCRNISVHLVACIGMMLTSFPSGMMANIQ